MIDGNEKTVVKTLYTATFGDCARIRDEINALPGFQADPLKMGTNPVYADLNITDLGPLQNLADEVGFTLKDPKPASDTGALDL